MLMSAIFPSLSVSQGKYKFNKMQILPFEYRYFDIDIHIDEPSELPWKIYTLFQQKITFVLCLSFVLGIGILAKLNMYSPENGRH
jgi:hypothetical protein